MNKIIMFAVIALIGAGILFFAMKSVDKNNQERAEKDNIFEISEEFREEEDGYSEIEEENNQEIEKEKNIDTQVKETTGASFIECLADKGVVIYGSKTCPACARLSKEYEKYDNIGLIYVECTEDFKRCDEEMLVGYVPAIQINGEIYDGWGSPENLAKETGCLL